MYEMYPHTWALAETRPGAVERPRRRPRKPHSAIVPLRVAANVASSRPVSEREAWT